jgi:glutathione S-transferase
MLKLFIAHGSISLASLILLEEVGASYEAVCVDFSCNEQQQDAYLKINPKGRVPSLVTENGILTETCAILVYIAQRFGQYSIFSNQRRNAALGIDLKVGILLLFIA